MQSEEVEKAKKVWDDKYFERLIPADTGSRDAEVSASGVDRLNSRHNQQWILHSQSANTPTKRSVNSSQTSTLKVFILSFRLKYHFNHLHSRTSHTSIRNMARRQARELYHPPGGPGVPHTEASPLYDYA